ncbi:serine-threonine kinase receptor-associated protein-like [Limulus polyphemus]|uniref:Serine-threonine kinase receptor-associated protein n=1 Tax=Limulus polyphemus TaxID=6850 RepID=A0ABM1BSC8_LIMPO|nr:serine-threonine kinase receptor-associated protein-like [Limulus polyphemus]
MAGMKQTPLTCSGHTRPVVHLAFSQITPYGYFLISACKDGKPMLRQGDTGDWIGTFVGHKGAVWGVALNKDASHAATGAADFTAKLWDAASGEDLHTFPHQHIVKSVNFSPDGKKLLTGSNEKIVRIFDINQYDAEPLLFKGHTSAIRHALFLKEEKVVISASDDKTVRIWDTGTQQEVKKLEFKATPSSLQVSQDGTLLVITHGSNISFWDANSYDQIKEYTAPTQVSSASLHPDNSVFVCGGEDFKMYKYDYETGAELDSFKGHFGPIHCVRFSPDGELYASGSEDGTLRLWQTTVGKTYGLWKCVLPDDAAANESGDVSSAQDDNSVKAEA